MDESADPALPPPLGSGVLKAPLPHLPLGPGDTIGGFEILRVVGAGAFATVYAARDGALGRNVAIKVVRLSPEHQQRMSAEARTMARLTHDNVVGVYEVGADGRDLYIVMELVEGPTLRRWLEQRPRTPREIVEVFVRAGRGLAAAHDARITHRDFKPDNVLVGAGGRIKVADFGLAMDRASGSVVDDTFDGAAATMDESTDSRPVRRRLTAGTPAYMAPEQLDGAEGDTLTDQFSFCVSLFEALYGERPFPGRSVKELRRQQRRGLEAERRRGRGVPRWLDRVVIRGLSRSPTRRWPSMHALVRALERGFDRRRRVWSATMATAIVAGVATALAVDRVHDRVSCTDAAEEVELAWNAPLRAEVQAALARGETSHGTPPVEAVTELDAYAAQWKVARYEACLAATFGRRTAGDGPLEACLQERRRALSAVVDVLRRGDGSPPARTRYLLESLPPVQSCVGPPVLPVDGGVAVPSAAAG